MPTRVLIVDDDPRFRALARTLLQASGYIVAAEAGDAEQALAAAQAVRPDAALVDVQLPGTDGLTLARALADAHGVRVLLTSTDPTLVPIGTATAFVAKDELAVADLRPWLGD
jgi:CheY-like chemotaxis protein